MSRNGSTAPQLAPAAPAEETLVREKIFSTALQRVRGGIELYPFLNSDAHFKLHRLARERDEPWRTSSDVVDAYDRAMMMTQSAASHIADESNYLPKHRLAMLYRATLAQRVWLEEAMRREHADSCAQVRPKTGQKLAGYADVRRAAEREANYRFIRDCDWRTRQMLLLQAIADEHERRQNWAKERHERHAAVLVELKSVLGKRVLASQVERLRALRDNDMSAYLTQLQGWHRERVETFFQLTDSKLRQIHAIISGSELLSFAACEYDQYQKLRELTQPAGLAADRQLKPYQVIAIYWMRTLVDHKLSGILADDMGLGKTVQTIAFISLMRETRANAGPYLIVAPLSTLGNWVSEFEAWLPGGAELIVFRGGPDARETAWAEFARLQRQRLAAAKRAEASKSAAVQAPDTSLVLLTSYELLLQNAQRFSRITWSGMILDEGHRIKNANSKLADLLRSLGPRLRFKLLLTGTPLQNDLSELWSLLNFLMPSLFDSAEAFESWFGQESHIENDDDDAAGCAVAGADAPLNQALNREERFLVVRRLQEMLRPFLLRRTKVEVLRDLPPKHSYDVFVSSTPLQRALRALARTQADEKKIAAHPYTIDAFSPNIDWEADDFVEQLIRLSGKFAVVADLLAKARLLGHRVLIFSQMRRTLDFLELVCEDADCAFLRIDGDSATDDRARALAAFNAPDSPYACFLLSTRAGGQGLNLQTADTVIIFDSDWNPHADRQAADRVHRIGQTVETVVMRLHLADSIDAAVTARASAKAVLDAQVIQAGRFDQTASREQREAILRALVVDGPALVQTGAAATAAPTTRAQLSAMLARSAAERQTLACAFDDSQPLAHETSAAQAQAAECGAVLIRGTRWASALA